MEKVFIPGLFFKKPSPKAPEYVIGSLSAKRDDLVAFLMAQKDEWVNMAVKEAKSGKCYVELDTWKPTKEVTYEKGIERTGEPVKGDDGVEVPF